MKEKSRPTVFGYLLLGLIQNRPQSGYSIRQVLKSMPITRYTDSPGSVYPALANLKKAELIKGRAEGAPSRPRMVFSITGVGKDILKEWMMSPLEVDKILHQQDALFVKLSFSDLYFKDEELASLVQSIQKTIGVLETELKFFHKTAGPRMQKGGNMAIELALEMLSSYARWAKRTLKEF